MPTKASSSRSRRVTIEDVARHAGVSRAAVSRVMRDAVGASPQTRARVRAAIEELSYRPHVGARGMRGRTYALGVVVSEIRDPWHAGLVDVISARAHAAGNQLLVGAARAEAESESATIQALTDHGVDGVILLGPRIPEARIAEAAQLTPLVVFGRGPGSGAYDSVTVDNDAGMRLAIDHLVALGHREIAHIAARPDAPASTIPALQRAAAYEQEMRERGLPAIVALADHSDAAHGGYAGGRDLLARGRHPTAIVADSDVAAVGVLAAAAEAGVQIPRDVSLVGWDNTQLSAMLPVSLTTVDQDCDDVGGLLAELLLERTEGRRTTARSITTIPRLIERDSTAPARQAG